MSISKKKDEGGIKLSPKKAIKSVEDPQAETTADVVEAPKKKGRRSWKPGGTQDIPEHLKDPNYVYRFVNTEQPGNLRIKRQEGWEVDEKIAQYMRDPLSDLGDKNAPHVANMDVGRSLDSSHVPKGQLVMRLHKDLAEERKKYYTNLAEGRLENNKALLESDTAGSSYGDIKVEQG